MATVSTPVRQPFGILDDSKLRNLQSIKNRQNAITPHSAPSLKRRAPSPELSDSENIDPAAFESSVKRKRAFFDDDVSLAKQSNSLRTKIAPPSKPYTPPTPCTIYTPRVETFVKPATTPLSAPVTAAGRSPTRFKPLKPQTRRRFAPPSLTSASPTLSLAAALKGTLAHGKRSSKSTSRRTSSRGTNSNEIQPKSWDFAIFEESEEQQDYRMCEWTMTQSSAALEISDDESKAKSFNRPEVKDDKGKENIDPNQMLSISAPVLESAPTVAVSEEANESMDTQEPRTPLGDLNASEFYGEGLNATSVVLVHEDDVETDVEAPVEGEQSREAYEPTPVEAIVPPTDKFTFEVPRQPSPELSQIESIPEWARRTTLLFDESFEKQSEPSLPDVSSEEPIEIWESQSAKDESEHHQNEEEEHRQCIVVGEGETISLSGPCLSEL